MIHSPFLLYMRADFLRLNGNSQICIKCITVLARVIKMYYKGCVINAIIFIN